MERRMLEGGLCLQPLLMLSELHRSMAEHAIPLATYQPLIHNMKIVLSRVGLAVH
jgi:hypothetical protein